MKLSSNLLALGMLAILGMAAGCGESGEEWILTFEDEFEGPAGQLPSAEKWQFDIGTGWGNAQLEFDSNRPENCSLDGNGRLVITAREEQLEGSDYTSARIKTQGLFEQGPGRYEARIKLPVGRGIWPAFWLLGADFPQVGWPDCGEIDILEYRGQQPTRLIASVHGPGYSGGNAISGDFILPGGAGLNEDFHVYGIEWDNDRITWILDGMRYQVLRRQDLPSGGEWVFDHPFFMILNVAVGGNFVGSPDESTNFPQEMLVDWVRVYRAGS